VANVIFSDECRMEVTSSYRWYVRRPDGHRFDPKYIMKNVRYCSKSVLIWGAIKGMAAEFSLDVQRDWIPLHIKKFWTKAFKICMPTTPSSCKMVLRVIRPDPQCHILITRKFVFLVTGHHSHLTSMS